MCCILLPTCRGLSTEAPATEEPPAAAADPAGGGVAGSAGTSATGMDTARTSGMDTARGPDTGRSYGSARSGGQTARSAFAPSQYSYRSHGSGGGVSSPSRYSGCADLIASCCDHVDGFSLAIRCASSKQADSELRHGICLSLKPHLRAPLQDDIDPAATPRTPRERIGLSGNLASISMPGDSGADVTPRPIEISDSGSDEGEASSCLSRGEDARLDETSLV